MVNMKRVLGTTLVAVAMAVGGVAFTSSAWAVEANACGLGADPPNGNNDGTGSRFECSGTVTLHVLVRKDVLGFDETAGEVKRSNFSNGNLTANGDCMWGRGNYYTETRSSTGNKIQSGRVVRC